MSGPDDMLDDYLAECGQTETLPCVECGDEFESTGMEDRCCFECS